MLFSSSLFIYACGLSASAVAAQRGGVVDIPSEYTYNLPGSFTGNNSEPFWDTQSSDSSVSSLFAQARNATFISYDPEFNHIFGSNPTANLIASGFNVAYEAGVWVPERNEVWFTTSVIYGPTTVHVLDLSNNNLRVPSLSDSIVNPNGGYYWDGLVYFTTGGNHSVPGSVVSVNPASGDVKTVVNSYFGLQYTFLDDVTWASVCNKSYMYFTDVSYRFEATGNSSQLPNAVYRYDPQEHTVLPVVSRLDVSSPNGVRVSPDNKKMYIGDFPLAVELFTPNGSTAGVPALYEYNIDREGRPINRRLFAQAPTTTGADGIQIDNAGRVWTGELSGVVVRNPSGKVIGTMNAEQLLLPALQANGTAIANFALAGDEVVVFAIDQIWRIKLAETIITADRFNSSSK